MQDLGEKLFDLAQKFMSLGNVNQEGILKDAESLIIEALAGFLAPEVMEMLEALTSEE